MGLTTPVPVQLVGWTPIRLGGRGLETVVDWCYTAGEYFDDPFFDQTVERCLRQPFRLLFRHQTPLATLGQVAAAVDALPLAGLVFHCSRCGSTLVSQMLAHLPTVQVMAEPPPVHSVLAACSARAISEEQCVEWLRWMVTVLGQPRRAEQRHLVVKLDAWAVLYLPLILRAFPNTPWVFVYRDPVEVLVSHVGHRGYHMVPGCLPRALLGPTPAGTKWDRLSPEEYMGLVLGALLGAAGRGAGDARSRLVNYRELPEAVTRRIAPWFGIDVSPDQLSVMSGVATRDAKNRYVEFEADAERKQAQARAPVRAAVERWVQPAYESMETMRLAQL